MTHRTRTRALSWLLALVMVIGLLPVASLPAGALYDDGTYQVVFSDGTRARMTEDELRAEAERHVGDEDGTVTIEGTELTWGAFKTMLSVNDLRQLIEDGVIGSYDLTDEAHAPYTASLMRTLLGSGAASAETVKVYLTKQSDNHYKVDTAKTANYQKYRLDGSTVYIIEDDAVTTDGDDIYVEIEADDFSVYDDYSVATMTISGNNGSLTVTASRTGSTELAAKLNYSVYVTKQKATQDGSDTILVESGSITIPAGQTTAAKTVTLQDAQKSTKPEAAYVRFEAAENCTLKQDANGSEIRGAACLMGNGYQSSYLVDGNVLIQAYDNSEEETKALFYDFCNEIFSGHVLPVLESHTAINKELKSGQTVHFDLTTQTYGEQERLRGGDIKCFQFSLDPEAISAKLIKAGKLSSITPTTFRIKADVNAGPFADDLMTFQILEVSGDQTPYTYSELDTNQSPVTIVDGEDNWKNGIYTYTSKPLPLKNRIALRESGQFERTKRIDRPNKLWDYYRYADNDISLYFYPERVFDAAIPAGSGTTPVYLPGDVVPIMVRSTTDFASGDSQTVSVTYNAGNEKKTVTCSTVLGRYGSDEGQYCTVLFGWTVPEDCTGGQLTLSEFKNGTSEVTLVGDGKHEKQTINAVNCNIDYSNRTAAFGDASIALVDDNGNKSDDGDLALILPVKDNTIAWWEWIAGEANAAMQAGKTAPYAVSSMYATFGEDAEKHPLYVHQKDGTATITVQGQPVNVSEIVDYLWLPLETGRLSAVHLYYKGYDTSDSTVPDYKKDATGFIDAYLNNHKLFYSALSGAGYEYPVVEYDPESETDNKPETQEYYTLKAEGDITLGYNATWNHFLGYDDNTDHVTKDTKTKAVPPRVENYVAATPGAEPLTLTYTRTEADTAGKKYSFANAGSFRWVSSDEEIATVEGVTKNGVKTGVITLTGSKFGEVTFTLVCKNGKHPVAVGSATLVVTDSPDPYLYVPSTSAVVTTRQGLGATVNFASNLTQRNANAAYERAIAEKQTEEAATAAANAVVTAFTLNVYAVDGKGDKTGDPVYTATEQSTLEAPVRAFSIPADTLSVGTYAAEVSAVYNGEEASLGLADKTSYTLQEGGGYLFAQKAKATIRVKNPVATVTITRPTNPHKNNEQSSFVLDSDKPVISWSVLYADAKKTKVEIKDAEGNSYQPTTETSFTFPEVPDGTLKKTYTVTVYATNNEEEDGWTVASSKIYVYNGDALDLLVYSVGYGNGQHSEQAGGENNKLLDKTGKPVDSAKIDNRRWLRSMLSEDGKTLDLGKYQYDLAGLQNDVNLSAAITLNFGSYAWGMISDQIEWKATKAPEDMGVLYYHQATQYVDIDDLALSSVFPTAEMVALGKANGTITVTATHAGTGQQTSVTLDYSKVTDEFYMFQFFPNAKTTVTYINGKGEEVTVYSDDKGQLALLEPDHIDVTKPVYLRCITDVTEKDADGVEHTREDVLFLGMIEPGDLRTGEVDAIENERYPVNVHHLSEPGKVQIYLQKPDKTPLAKNVEVTYRGGAFYGDEPYTYAPKADIFDESNRTKRNLEDENLSNGLHDNKQKTDADGALTFYFNLDQVTGGVDSIDLAKDFQYVFELQVPGYLPFVIRVDPYHATVTEVLRNVQSEREIAVANKYSWAGQKISNSPIPNAIILKRGKEVEYAPLSGNTSRIGNNGQYQSAVLEYETLLWNDSYKALMSEDPTTKQWSVTGKTNLNQYFYDPNASTKLGNGFTEQRGKQASEVWCFPFSTWPLITASLTMDPAAFGVNADGSSTGRTWLEQYHRTRANVYLKDGDTFLKQMNFEYFIFNGTGMLEPLNSKKNMQKLQETIDGLSDDMNSFHIADMVSDDNVLMKPVKSMAKLVDGVLKETTGFTMEPYFAATLDPTVYYVFLNMKQTPRQAAFAAVLDSGDIAIDEYVEPNDSNGINAAYGEYKDLFDKLNEPLDEQGKVVGLDSFANRHKSITFDTGGSLLLRAEFDPATQSWKMYYISGTVDSFLQVGIKFSFSPVPMVNLGIGTFVGADKLFKAQNRVDANDIQRYDLIRQLSVGGGINVSAGIGIPNLGIVEVQLCVTGSVKYTYSNAKLKSTLYRPYEGDDETDLVVSQDGKKHKLTGMIGLQLEVGVFLASVSYSFFSTNFDLGSWPTPEYNKLRDVWEGKATVLGSDGSLQSVRYLAMRSGGDQVSLQFEKQSLNLRTMLSAVNAQETLFKTYKNIDGPKNIVLGDDGAVFFLDDYVASWANADGTAQGGIVEVQTPLMGSGVTGDFGHSYLDASGSGSNRFAVWSTQTQEAISETGLGSDVEVTAQDIGAALKSTEITAAYYNGSAWTKTQLTTNTYADVLPKVTSNGNKAVVIWQQGESSQNGETIFDAGKFDVDNRIMMSQFDGTTWSTPQTLFSTAAVGELGNMNLALLNDTTAIIAYTLGADIQNKDVFYSIVDLGTGAVTSYRVTEDAVDDANVQVQAVSDGEAVLAWYSAQGSEADITGDIHLLGVYANGTTDPKIPESIGVADEAEVNSDFRLAGSSLNGLTVAWVLSDEVPDKAIVGSSALYGVQLYSDEGKTVVSPVQRLNGITSGTNISINGFDMLANGQSVTAVLEEKDYTTGRTETYTFGNGSTMEVPVGDDRLEKRSGSFTDTLEVSDPVYNAELAAPNSELQVSYTVRNHGVHKITGLTLNGKTTDVTLYPGESTVLTETVAFGSAVQDHPYTIAATSDVSYGNATGTIRFNIPQVSVQEVSVREVKLDAPAGKRTIDVSVGNNAGDTLPITNDKTLTVQLFSDMEGEHKITEPQTVGTGDYRRINNSSVTVSFNTTVDDVFKSLGRTGTALELPESGLPVFAIAQVKDKDGATVLSSSVNMTTLKPVAKSEDEGSVETKMENWKQDTDEAAKTNSATVVVSYTNTSLTEAPMPKYTLVKAFDENGLLLAEQFKKNSGSVNGEGMALDEITIALPLGKTVSLVTAEAMDDLTLDERPTASGYSFGGWYADKEYQQPFRREVQKDGDGKEQKDENGNLIYVPITVGADGTFTVYTRWTRSSSGGAPAKTVTAPVTGDVGTVTVTATVKGTDATIAPLTTEQLDSIVGSGASSNQSSIVAIDVSNLGTQVKAVTIPAETVKAIEAAVSDKTKDADSLTVKLTEGSVTFDTDAVKAIAAETKGDGLKVNLDDIGTEKLNTAQKSAVSDLAVESVLDAYVTSGATRISDFKGGSATVSVKHTLKAAQSPAGIVVWYVADNGTRTQIPATFRNGEVVFTVSHFSNYVIAYDAEKAAAAGKLGAFTDLDSGAWYADGVLWALNNGVMNGWANPLDAGMLFGPNDSTTRAMVATMLWRMEGSPAYAGASEFTDVDGDTWYTEAVRWASTEGIVEGYANPTGAGKLYNPNGAVTREQLAAMLYRYAQYKKADVSVSTSLSNYGDAQAVSGWAASAMQWAVGSGVINGMDGNLAPKGKATRAQVATMLMRYSTAK